MKNTVKNFKKSILFFLLIFFGYANSVAVTVTLYAEADATVKASSPGSNYGDNEYLIVNGGNETYLRFDLSSISGTIKNAVLKINMYDINTRAKLRAKRVVSDAWSEGEITYDSKPDFFETIFETDYTSSGWNDWLSFDVTSQVGAELADGKFSVAITSVDGNWVTLKPREYSNSQFHPVLVVEYLQDNEPIANGDSYSVCKNNTLSIVSPGVLSNDVPSSGVSVEIVWCFARNINTELQWLIYL